MKTLFCSQDVWDLVESGFPELANQQAYQALSQAEKDLLKENMKRDAKSLLFIHQEVEEVNYCKRQLLKTLFHSQDVLDLVESVFPELANQQAYQSLSQAEKDLLKENRNKDAKAFFFIQQALEEAIFPKEVVATS